MRGAGCRPPAAVECEVDDRAERLDVESQVIDLTLEGDVIHEQGCACGRVVKQIDPSINYPARADLGFVRRPNLLRWRVTVKCAGCGIVHHVQRVPGGVTMTMSLPRKGTVADG
jgi:hypothetical protein